MAATLADRLRSARHDAFVGRGDEVDRFTAALTAETLPFHVLHVYGPGGVGKTTLLHEFRHRCEEAGVSVRYLDARDINATPAALLDALRRAAPALALPAPDSPVGGDGGPARIEGASDGDGHEGATQDFQPTRYVLLLDTFEAIHGLDDWLREDFLPQMPEGLLVVVAGRHAPSPAWRTDPGWRALSAVMPLRSLSPEESRALLLALGVSEQQVDTALDFAGGHPLALALVAEACRLDPSACFDPADAPGVIGALVQRFVREIPDDDHRTALESCALVHATTESLLSTLLERPAADLFAWLQGRTFVQEALGGLFPHDLARDAIVAELRWRAPERYDALHTRARRYYTARLQEVASPEEHRRVLAAYAFLYRDNPVTKTLIAQLRSQWRSGGPGAVDAPRADEWDSLVALVEKYEGAEGARCAAYWFERQPQAVEVLRGVSGEVAGLLVGLRLDKMTEDDLAADPAVAAASAALHGHAPLREGERALLFRFWLGSETYQAPSAFQSALFAQTAWHYLTTSDLAYSLILCAAPHDWEALLAFTDFHRLPAADATVGGQRFEAFAHDWRATPPSAWLHTLAARSPSAAPVTEAPVNAFVVLGQSDFAAAVKDALKAFARPQLLLENPLLDTRLIGSRAGVDADEATRADVLRTVIEETAHQLEGDPRSARYYRALHTTYLQPAPSQAIAAERLDLPSSTFRRHLDRGVRYVTETLWAQEVG